MKKSEDTPVDAPYSHSPACPHGDWFEATSGTPELQQSKGYASVNFEWTTESGNHASRANDWMLFLVDCGRIICHSAIKNDSSAILRRGKRFVVRADAKLTAFIELESAIRIWGHALHENKALPN